MADSNDPQPVARSTKLVSEALLNEKVPSSPTIFLHAIVQDTMTLQLEWDPQFPDFLNSS